MMHSVGLQKSMFMRTIHKKRYAEKWTRSEKKNGAANVISNFGIYRTTTGRQERIRLTTDEDFVVLKVESWYLYSS